MTTSTQGPDLHDTSESATGVQWLQGGGITSPRGFRAAGVHCGIKKSRLDLALLDAGDAVPTAGMFTTNRVQAAPVLYCKEALSNGPSKRAILINSGNANACTGEPGLEDARRMAELASAALGVAADQVLVCSTGVIGQRLPMAAVEGGIQQIVPLLASGDASGEAAADAILTTDTVRKACACRVELSRGSVLVGGMAKGSGMIAPDLELPHATTLAFLTTDATLDAADLERLLERSMHDSFNAITVDSDTSTNDTVLLMANGAAGVAPETESDRALLQAAIHAVSKHLALEVVRDGEGANRVLEIRVSGGASEGQARQVARGVADSPLVKTAFHAGEPNWGRLLMAVGKSHRGVDADRIAIAVGGLEIVRAGLGTEHDASDLSRRMTTDEVLVEIDLGLGCATTSVWTCDLSAEYVRINASYMS